MNESNAREIIAATNLSPSQSNFQLELYFEAVGYVAALEGEEMKETKAMVVELEDMVVKATVKLQQLFVEMKAKDAEIADKIKWIKAELKAEREKSAKLVEVAAWALDHLEEYNDGCLHCGQDEDYVSKHGEISEDHRQGCPYYKGTEVIAAYREDRSEKTEQQQP